MQARHVVWGIIGTIVGSHIWRARCVQVLGGETRSVVQILADVCSEIVRSLKSQWDQIQGNSRARANFSMFGIIHTRGVKFHPQSFHSLLVSKETRL